ncbi:MAG TPA: hypothetical protein VN408_18970, partial [Actinoplanes sp.]|nr:hypothetical protein [Actinoplanes sp.]
MLAAIPLGLIPIAPALAATAQCPASGCDGAWVSDSNCGTAAAQTYPIASMLIQHQMQPTALPEWMIYSPLCDTFWGQIENSFTGYNVGVQIWRQPEYGGRNTLAYFAVEDKGGRSTIETRMYSAKKGSVKFCVSHDAADPDL